MKIKFFYNGDKKIEFLKIFRQFTDTPMMECKNMIDKGAGEIEVSDIYTFADVENIFLQHNARIELIENKNKIENVITQNYATESVDYYEVTLLSVLNKLGTIKFLREEFGISIVDCKTATENLPYKFDQKIDKAKVNRFLQQSVFIGFTVDIKKIDNKKMKNENIDLNIQNTGKNIFKIEIHEVGNNKIAVIKVLRETLGESLAFCKNLIDNPPFRFYVKQDLNEINKLINIFKDAGAKVSQKQVNEIETGYKLIDYKHLIKTNIPTKNSSHNTEKKHDKTIEFQDKNSQINNTPKINSNQEINKPKVQEVPLPQNNNLMERTKMFNESEGIKPIIIKKKESVEYEDIKTNYSKKNNPVNNSLVSSLITLIISVYTPVSFAYLLILINSIYIAYTFRKYTTSNFQKSKSSALIINFLILSLFIIYKAYRWSKVYDFINEAESFWTTFTNYMFSNTYDYVKIILSFVIIYFFSIKKYNLTSENKTKSLLNKSENKQEKKTENRDYKKSNEDFFKNKRNDLPF